MTHAHCMSSARAYIARSEIELQKATATGITFLVCSQDEGAPSEANILCDNTQKPVWPVYPGSSAFVTSVSGTSLRGGRVSQSHAPPICKHNFTCSGGVIEEPCTVNNTALRWTTGGGFSEFIPSPSWQTEARIGYLNSGVTFPKLNHFNSSNRFYADVSAFGGRLLVVQKQQVTASGGSKSIIVK